MGPLPIHSFSSADSKPVGFYTEEEENIVLRYLAVWGGVKTLQGAQ